MTPNSKRILDIAYNHICSIPYKASVRWLFYRLYQDGVYPGKTEKFYKKWEYLCVRARRTFYKEWYPGSLVDETRAAIEIIGEFEDAMTFNDELPSYLVSLAKELSLDHFYRQPNYCELWFEARAMIKQFRYFTRGIDLVPMGGSSSVSLRWDLAKRLEEKLSQYGKPIIILYFGDEDEAGHIIQDSTEKEVRAWSKAPFELVRCGLTQEQALHYNVPNNSKGKGYQWEALSHEAAGEIITENISRFIDLGTVDEVAKESERLSAAWAEKINRVPWEEL